MKNSLFEYFVIFGIRAYQRLLSPFFISTCRFSPSCSNYAILSVKKHGVFKGLFYSINRLLRCHPFYRKTGYDPVP